MTPYYEDDADGSIRRGYCVKQKCLALTTWPPQRLGICHGPIQPDGSCKAHSDAAKDDDPSREHQLELR